MNDDHGFASMTEYLEAVRRASAGGAVDPRLRPAPPPEPLAEDQLARLERLADELDPPEEQP